LVGRSRAFVGFGVSAATTLGSIYTIDCVMKELGYEPFFFPLIKRLLPQPSKIANDPVIACDREHENLKNSAKQGEKRHLSVIEDQELFTQWYRNKYISREEFIDLTREIYQRKRVIVEERKVIVIKMMEILIKAYGPSDEEKSKALEALEALKEQETVTEDLSPKTPWGDTNEKKKVQ